MNLEQAQKQMRYEIVAGNAVLLRGPSGLGKTSIAYAEAARYVAQQKEKGKTCGVCIIHAAHYSPADILGVQFKGEREYGLIDVNGEPVMKDGQQVTKKITVTDPSCPLWMMTVPFGDDPGGRPAFLYDSAFLIIDEWGQGEPDTKRALAEPLLHGTAQMWRMPEGSPRIACTNKGSRYGVTKEWDFVIARRTELDIEG